MLLTLIISLPTFTVLYKNNFSLTYATVATVNISFIFSHSLLTSYFASLLIRSFKYGLTAALFLIAVVKIAYLVSYLVYPDNSIAAPASNKSSNTSSGLAYKGIPNSDSPVLRVNNNVLTLTRAVFLRLVSFIDLSNLSVFNSSTDIPLLSSFKSCSLLLTSSLLIASIVFSFLFIFKPK